VYSPLDPFHSVAPEGLVPLIKFQRRSGKYGGDPQQAAGWIHSLGGVSEGREQLISMQKLAAAIIIVTRRRIVKKNP